MGAVCEMWFLWFPNQGYFRIKCSDHEIDPNLQSQHQRPPKSGRFLIVPSLKQCLISKLYSLHLLTFFATQSTTQYQLSFRQYILARWSTPRSWHSTKTHPGRRFSACHHCNTWLHNHDQKPRRATSAAARRRV